MRALSRESVQYVMDSQHVSRSEAEYRLATQALAPDPFAVLSLGGNIGYVDSWWDTDTGQLVVLAERGAAVADIKRALTARGLVGTDFRISSVEYSRNELSRVYADIAREMAPAIRTAVGKVGTSQGRISIVLAEGGDPSIRETAMRVAAKYDASDPPVAIERSPESTLDVPSQFCDAATFLCNQIVGGQRFTNPGVGHCTLAYFVGWRGRNPWVPSYLTAGHCLSPRPLVTPQSACRIGSVGCGPIGLSLQYFVGYGRGDVGMIDLYAPGWQIRGGWWNWSVGTFTAVSSILWNAPGAGYVVCKNGATTGSTCGTVLRTSVDVSIGGIPHSGMIESQGMLTCPGDSGSPVTSASVSAGVGVHAGGFCAPGGEAYHTPLWQPTTYFDLNWYSGGPFGPYA